MDQTNSVAGRRQGASSPDLWDAFDSLRDEFERAFGAVEIPGVSGLLDWSTSPPIDLVEGDEEVLVLADLPGLRKEDIELSIQGSILTISGEKRREEPSQKRRVVRSETWAGRFSRSLRLPDSVNPDRIEAQLRDGILRVRIAKREEARRRTLQISVK